MTRNSLSVARVWMDDYIEFFFEVNPEARNLEYGDVSKRVELRQKLNCHSFEWYLENVYPNLPSPPHKGPDTDRAFEARKKAKMLRQGYDAKAKDAPKYEPWDRKSRNYLRSFLIKLTGTNLCIQSEGRVPQKG